MARGSMAPKGDWAAGVTDRMDRVAANAHEEGGGHWLAGGREVLAEEPRLERC